MTFIAINTIIFKDLCKEINILQYFPRYDADSITYALTVIEGVTDSSAIFLYMTIIIHILFVDTLKTKSTYLIIQLQVLTKFIHLLINIFCESS